MGMFSKINAAAAPSGGGYYLEPGEYELEVSAVKKATNKGEALIVEFLVLESNNEARPAGSRPAWVQCFYGRSAVVAPQHAKMFMVAASGLNIFDPKDAKQIEAEDWETFGLAALEADQPLAGCRIHAVISPRAGKKYLDYKFTPSKNLSKFQLELAEARK